MYLCIVLKSYKYRLYPTVSQKDLLEKHFGTCRFIYNLALETKNYAYTSHRKNLSCFDLINQLPELKNEYIWLKEVDSQCLRAPIIDLDKAFIKFFKGTTNFPKFKKKTSNKSFRSAAGKQIKIIGKKVIIPKFQEGIKFVQDKIFTGKIKNATISKTSTDKYFISIVVEDEKELPECKPVKDKTAIGIDLGITSYIVTSDGLKTNNPRFLKNKIKRLKVLQHRMRNKKKGSNNQKKSYKKIALVHEKIANQRKDFLQKLSTELINNHDTICLEDLKINNHSMFKDI